MTGTFLRSASSRIRSLTSADCVGAPPGELIASATADSFSWSNALTSACSTVLMLIVPRLSGDGVGVMTPCSFTTATTGLAVARFIGRRAVSFSVTLMEPPYVSLASLLAHVPDEVACAVAGLARHGGRVAPVPDRCGGVRVVRGGAGMGRAQAGRGVGAAGVVGVRVGRP